MHAQPPTPRSRPHLALVPPARLAEDAAGPAIPGVPEQPGRRLHVALIAPPWLPPAPLGYGGIERVVGWLGRALADRGHLVTVLGAGTPAVAAGQRRWRYVPVDQENPPRAELGGVLAEVSHAAAAHRLLAELDPAPDIVHDHSAAGPLTAAARTAPTVVTAHGPVAGRLGRYYEQLPHLGSPAAPVLLVAISNAQRRSGPNVAWQATVHNGIRVAALPYRDRKEDYCLFLGRINPEKAPELAIHAARQARVPIILAAKCSEPAEHRYFAKHVQPLLGPGVHWAGEVDEPTKRGLLARARCLVFPIQWDEPFGLVMVEAMACGTPVVTLDRGATAEIVDHQRTGIICGNPEELAAAIRAADHLDPADCRAHAARHFDLDRMAAGYEHVYHHAIRAR